MPARARIELGLGHVEQVETAFANEQAEVERARIGAARGGCIEHVDAAGLEAALARARKVLERLLSVGGDDTALGVVAAELVAIVQRFVAETGWTPSVTRHIAGALLYTRYNIFKRWMMRRIVAKAHGDTDISRDYVYTDWDEVRAFAREFGRRLEPAAA